jgi:hypothetical protein
MATTIEEDDAAVKVKVVADKYPFRLVLVTWSKKYGWVLHEIKAH